MSNRNANERLFIIILIAIMIVSLAQQRNYRLLDARVTNIEAAKP